MKRNLLLLLLLFSIILCTKAVEPLKYGVIGGMNVSSISTDRINSRIGFHIGAKAELPLPSNFFIESSLLFSLKGFKANNYNVDLDNLLVSKVKLTQENYYMELPIHLGYKLAVSDDCSLLFTGGGYIGFGLFGKDKVGGESKSLYKKDSGEKRFDCGLGIKVGAEFTKTIQVSASYDWGLVNLYKHSNDYKNRNLMLSFAYMFK